MRTSSSIFLVLSFLFCLIITDGMPSGRGRGGGGNRQNRQCKYEKGPWGECDAATSKKTRTETLTPGQSSNCTATRVSEKACKRKTCEYGEWTEYGQCESGRQTKTRPILTGTNEECGRKAKKTKPCRNGGGGGGGGGRGQGGRRGAGGARRRQEGGRGAAEDQDE